MKITTNELKEKLKIVKTVIPAKATNAALECALIKNRRIYGSNSLIVVSAPIDLDGEFLIPKRAMDIINYSYAPETEFIITDKTLTVKSDKATSRFPALNPDDYIEIPRAEENVEVHTLSADKLGFINDVAYAASTSDERPIYKSVLFGKEIVALDGVRVAVVKSGVDFECIIPSGAFKALSLLENKDVKFSEYKYKLFFDDGNVHVTVSGISGEYMDYHRIIPKAKYSIEIERNELLEKLEMINAAVSDKHKSSLKINISNGEFKMTISDCDITFEDSMEINADFEFDFKINPKFLYDAVKSFDYDFKMSLDSNKTPVILENENQLALVTPML